MDSLYKDLNKAQLEAIQLTEGPVMAIAGAGSGKTRVLTRRMAHIIYNLGVDPHHILAITFTNKAANEMKERIHRLLKIQTRSLWVSTFHSMCARILRQYIEHLGYDKHFQIIDDDDTLQLVKIILKRHDIDTKVFKPHTIKRYILEMKQDPTMISAIEEPLKTILKKAFPAYQKHLKNNNLVDFEDLLILTIKLLKDFPEIRKVIQGMFKYVLVDEFQDTNNVQYELIKLLVNPKYNNLFIVGDEDQSIYAFRGANIANIRKFEKDFPETKKVLLEQNYRSTNTILKAANSVISHNRNRNEKTLFSTRGEGQAITSFKGFTHRDEAHYVAETIRALTYEKYRYEDIAILYRANNTSRTFEEVLMQKRMPYQLIGNMSFFKRKEIKDMTAYLRLIVNPNDDYSFMRIVNEPRRGIGAKTIETLTDFAEYEEVSLYQAIHEQENPLSTTMKKRLKTFRSIIDILRTSLENTELSQLIDDILELTGYKKYLSFDDKYEIRLENIFELKSLIEETKRVIPYDTKRELLVYVLEEIALRSQEEEHKDKNVITLMTLHAAKGVEYKVVFIVGLENNLFPIYRALGSPTDLEEERRLLYVGMTRAMDRLYLTNAQERMWYGDIVHHTDSMFLDEIPAEYIKQEGLRKPKERVRKPARSHQKPVYEPRENDLQKGDKIIHKTFGPGYVVSVSGDQCLIAFRKPHGIKTLMKNHPAIEKQRGDDSWT